jgi:hypothetical protein
MANSHISLVVDVRPSCDSSSWLNHSVGLPLLGLDVHLHKRFGVDFCFANFVHI